MKPAAAMAAAMSPVSRGAMFLVGLAVLDELLEPDPEPEPEPEPDPDPDPELGVEVEVEPLPDPVVVPGEPPPLPPRAKVEHTGTAVWYAVRAGQLARALRIWALCEEYQPRTSLE
jgi:hypothetical protein